MAFIFPEDKADFTAPNGVTYHYDGAKWVTKTFKADESALVDYVKIDDFEKDQERQDTDFAADQDRQDEAFAQDQDAQDQLIADNRRSIEELEVTKGPVARYTCKGTSFNVASRNGDLYVSDATAANVTAISFAPFDLNGNPTRPVSAGDIVEFVESANLKSVGQVSRFRVVSGDDPSALTVTYLNGTNNFMVDETEEVYIYPQNEETASKEYVDSNFLPLTGGSLTGQLNTDSLIKSTRNTGYALQLWPDNGDSISWLHTNGTFHFGGKGTIHGDLDIESQSSSGVRILGSLKVKETGNAINQSNCFEVFGDRANYYGSTSSDENIATVGHVKLQWPVSMLISAVTSRVASRSPRPTGTTTSRTSDHAVAHLRWGKIRDPQRGHLRPAGQRRRHVPER